MKDVFSLPLFPSGKKRMNPMNSEGPEGNVLKSQVQGRTWKWTVLRSLSRSLSCS